MGGALLQHMNRDTQRFAMKASSMFINGEERDVFKQPATDMGKASKAGRLMLYRNKSTGKIFTGRLAHGADQENDLLLEPVYHNGRIMRVQTLKEIRDIANS
jgi:nicotinamide phosphoribosyltransferase